MAKKVKGTVSLATSDNNVWNKKHAKTTNCKINLTTYWQLMKFIFKTGITLYLTLFIFENHSLKISHGYNNKTDICRSEIGIVIKPKSLTTPLVRSWTLYNYWLKIIVLLFITAITIMLWHWCKAITRLPKTRRHPMIERCCASGGAEVGVP